MFDTAKDWAQRLLVKYGIMQPMAPEEPAMCSPVPPIPSHVTATYPAYFDNVARKDSKPSVGYPSSTATKADEDERRRRREEEDRRRRDSDSGMAGVITAGALLYVAQPSLFDMGRTSSPAAHEASHEPSPRYDSGSSYSSSSYDSGSSSYDSGSSSGGGFE